MKLIVNILAIGIFAIIISQVSCTDLKGNVKIYEYPWVASIQKNFVHSCAGSIISRNIVLTAASCFDAKVPLNNITVRVGSSRMDYGPAISGGSRQNVEVVVQHEIYRANRNSYNLALIRVSPLFDFSQSINKIELAGRDYVSSYGTKASVTGWVRTGRMINEELIHVQMKITDSPECNVFQHIFAVPLNGEGSMTGAGFPIVANGILIGISSNSTGCANSIAHNRRWINSNMKILGSISV